MPAVPTRLELRAFSAQEAVAGLPHGRLVQVWTVPLRASQQTIHRLQATLSPDELARAARFRFEDLRTSFVLTRGALRTILGLYLEATPQAIKFTYGPKGKPSVDSAARLHFNTSHSGDLAVFAFTRGCELGLDIEKLRTVENMQDIANRFFCAAEAAELMSLPPQQRGHAFFLCWTRKEAYLKATGEGLSTPLDSFRVSLEPVQPARLIHLDGSTEAAQQWTLHPLDIACEYIASLAYRDKERPVIGFPSLRPAELLRL